MKTRHIVILGFAATILFAAFLSRPGSPVSATMGELIELPRPNSPSFTFEQADARKGEIYRMKLTGRLTDWERPEYGTGFCVHITKDDSIIVEHFRMPAIEESEIYHRARDGIEALTGNRYIENPTHVYRDVSLTQLEELVFWSMDNEPAFVVLTSELEPGQSRVLPEVLDRLYRGTRLHYVPKKQQIEQAVGYNRR